MECGVCLEVFDRERRRPKVLPCGHSFCGLCLQSIRRCPMDDQPIPPNLADNYLALDLLGNENVSSQPPLGRRLWCQDCNVEASNSCVDSGHNLTSLKRARTSEVSQARAGLAVGMAAAAAVQGRLDALRPALEQALPGVLARYRAAMMQRMLEFRNCRDSLEDASAGAQADRWQQMLQQANSRRELGTVLGERRDLLSAGGSCTITWRPSDPAGEVLRAVLQVRPASEEPPVRLASQDVRQAAPPAAAAGPFAGTNPAQRRPTPTPPPPAGSRGYVLGTGRVVEILAGNGPAVPSAASAAGGHVLGSSGRHNIPAGAAAAGGSAGPAGPAGGPAAPTGALRAIEHVLQARQLNQALVRFLLYSLHHGGTLEPKTNAAPPPPAPEPSTETDLNLESISSQSSRCGVVEKQGMLVPGIYPQVRSIRNLYCNGDPEWALKLLRHLKNTLEDVQLTSPNSQHMETLQRMPQLRRLQVTGPRSPEGNEDPIRVTRRPAVRAGLRYLRVSLDRRSTMWLLMMCSETLEELVLCVGTGSDDARLQQGWPMTFNSLDRLLRTCQLRALRRLMLVRSGCHHSRAECGSQRHAIGTCLRLGPNQVVCDTC